MSSGTIAQGAIALISSAAGTRIALLTSEPLATAHTTGSSRFALTPATCCAFSARSSPSTPAVFLVATLVRSGDIVQDAGDVVEQGEETGAGHRVTRA